MSAGGVGVGSVAPLVPAVLGSDATGTPFHLGTARALRGEVVITTVILDVDGTLLDTNYLHVEAFAQAFREVGLTGPRRAIHRQIGKGSDLLLAEFTSDATQQRRVNQRHSELYPELQEHGYPLPGAIELLRSLARREYRVWLATSAKPEQIEGILRTLELDEHSQALDGVISSGEVDQAKPEPDLFEKTLTRAGCSPDEAVVVGDTVWDVEAASRAGLRTVGVLTGGAYSQRELEEAGAVAVFEDCAALLASNFPEGY
jgi:HAD superfamily hydrolase (TIGR01509 family)